MNTNVEKRILAISAQYLDNKVPSGDNTWYHCERLDKVTHHNSWVCQHIGSIDAVIKSHNPHAITKLVPVSWYVPTVLHKKVINRHLAETDVKII